MQREHVYERPGRSESRRRRRQRQFYRILAAIWLMAFVLGLLCGKLVFAKETGLLARAGAEPAAEASENDRTQTAEHDSGTADNPDGEESDGDWKLTLVNATHPMAEGYRPRVSEIENNYYFDSRAVGELQQMLADGRKEGLDFWICSAYRTMEKQTDLYNNKVSRLQAEGLSYEDAYRQAGTVVAYPGRYGFILRYPTDKTGETGIIFEPWHYRYVGKEAAREIMEQGICLEEYLGEK